MFFKIDGARPHWSMTVHESLNQHFQNWWTGCAGPIPWPSRSLIITFCDFFLRGYVKDHVHQTLVANISNMRYRIQSPTATADTDMMQHTWMELKYHLDTVCLRKWCPCWMCVMFRTNFVRGFVIDNA
jgi:hypothetical protein